MSVVRDGSTPVTCRHFRDDGVAGSLVYLVVDDVDGLHRELLGRDVPIDLSPTDQSWGNREMYVRDSDQNESRSCVRVVTDRGRGWRGCERRPTRG